MIKLRDRVRSVLKNKQGETIIEVVVAFALLSIMLIFFAQGLSWAANTEIHATENRKKADDSMIVLQEDLATTHPENGAPLTYPNDSTKTMPIKRYTYSVDGTKYVVYEFG
ncbi:MAG: hypothetical protein E7383_07995 [Ruminococcaceae bacterium]|jgi:hypothetical protein|nr:hypothetical protein [Oscillospiraceae bacterium]